MAAEAAELETTTREGFVRGLGLLDSTMIVAGSMIGSGIFIVSADIGRQVGSPGWLLVVWIVTGLLTVGAALSYGELAAMMPRAGGMYVYLKEAYGPLWGFLFGWTHFLVIGTATIAAVGVAFSRFTGIFIPGIAEDKYLIEPIRVGTSSYAFSLSTAQLLAIVMIVLLTALNTRGLKFGKIVQNIFTTAKTGALFALIVLGIVVGAVWYPSISSANFGDLWTVRGSLQDVGNGLTAATAFGLFVGICVAQTNSLFSADAWHNVTFTAGEVKNPKRDLPLSLLLGTGGVITLYLLANVAYLMTLRFEDMQKVAADRVGSASLDVVFPGIGAKLMAAAIIVSTFGCTNGLIFSQARAYYAMAVDGLFFKKAGQLNKFHVPGWALWVQGLWASFYVLPRTVKAGPTAGTLAYGNLYGDLLTYVISAALIFYILAIAAVFVLRVKRPDAERPYKAVGYPLIPALYIVGAAVILVVLFVYQTTATWPGLLIVLTGVPVYFIWRKTSSRKPQDVM
ncbi:MAG TPA: amino acid permease [Pyrinomonadaceae bacterium]